MPDHLESKAGVEFQREQQQKENEFRNREILVKETELDLKREESHRSRWSSPLVVAISVAAAGVFGNAAVTWWNSREQEKLERERAEAARILEVIKTSDADKAANNLAFLLDAGLISDSSTRKSLSTFLQARPPGKGPSLPSLVPTATVEVDPQFKQIQETVPQLGKPRLPAVLADDAYQAVYDQANVIWIKSLFSILTLPTDAARKVTWQEDTNYSKDIKYFNDDWLKTQFTDVPDGKYPPHGGVAYYWLQNPNQWKWVGWRRWYCRFFNQIRYQQFVNCTVIGIFHSDPAKNVGQIFIVLNDNSWLTKPAPSVAPNCIADPVGPHAEP